MSLRIGTAEVDITPEAGLPLMGNFRDDYAARGVRDPLLAKAMVFDDGQSRAAVLAVDLCMVDRENVAVIRESVARTSGVAAENVLVHATHTHSGPATSPRLMTNLDYEPCRERVREMLRLAGTAVAAAEGKMSPARISVGRTTESRVSFNRRLRRRDGSTQMNWEALGTGFDVKAIEGTRGPADHEMICMDVVRDDGARGVAVNFGLHPAILAGDNWDYSADYPGQLAAAMRRIHGDGVSTLFLNGCTGNVNHVDYREANQGRGYGMVERVGHMLAAGASEALRLAEPMRGETIAVERGKVELRRLPISEAEYARCCAVLEAAKDKPATGQVDGLPETHFAKLRVQMYRDQHQPDAVEVMTLRIGEIAIVGLPGEVFCEIGMEIKRRSAAKWTMVMGLCNDAIGYLPTRESFAQGGYETMVGSTFYEPGSAEALVEEAVRQIGS